MHVVKATEKLSLLLEKIAAIWLSETMHTGIVQEKMKTILRSSILVQDFKGLLYSKVDDVNIRADMVSKPFYSCFELRYLYF